MYQLAKIVNFAISGGKKTFLSFSICNIIFTLFARDFFFFIFLEIIILLFSVTLVRVSDILVYSKLFHIISMGLITSDYFKEYDYQTQKDKISYIFKEEFINGILNTNAKSIHCNSHKWVLVNVFQDERILSKYNLQTKKKGYSGKTLEVLLLSCGKKVNLHKRQDFKIILTRK